MSATSLRTFSSKTLWCWNSSVSNASPLSTPPSVSTTCVLPASPFKFANQFSKIPPSNGSVWFTSLSRPVFYNCSRCPHSVAGNGRRPFPSSRSGSTGRDECLDLRAPLHPRLHRPVRFHRRRFRLHCPLPLAALGRLFLVAVVALRHAIPGYLRASVAPSLQCAGHA